MGEYAKINGQQLKIGTCEDMYYISYQKLQQLINSKSIENLENSTKIEDLIKSDSGIRFRFPFLDEAHLIPNQIEDYNRRLLLNIPERINIELGHLSMNFNSTSTDNTHVSMMIPCIQAKAMKEDKSLQTYFTSYSRDLIYNNSMMKLNIVQQRLVGEELQLIVECPYCNQKSRLDKTEAIALLEHLNENISKLEIVQQSNIDKMRQYQIDEYRNIVEHIETGYNIKN